jgi:hypothetical protein
MFLLLLACAPQNDTNLPSEDWSATVTARIAAEAQAVLEDDDGFSVRLLAANTRVWFDDHGARLGEELPVTVGLQAWGFDGALAGVAPVAPQLGECGPAIGPSGDCLRRLEHDHGDVVTWWLGLEGGVELGWTVPEAPAGAALMSFVVQHDGAERVEAAGEGAVITAADGRLWTVSAPVAWDADGAALLATARVDGEALIVEVDVRGAAFPVTVDPVYSTADTTLHRHHPRRRDRQRRRRRRGRQRRWIRRRHRRRRGHRSGVCVSWLLRRPRHDGGDDAPGQQHRPVWGHRRGHRRRERRRLRRRDGRRSLLQLQRRPGRRVPWLGLRRLLHGGLRHRAHRRELRLGPVHRRRGGSERRRLR